MPRRNQRLDYLLSSGQQRRLRLIRGLFLAALDESPRNQTLINKLRAQLPPGGLSWPLWSVVLAPGRTDFNDENRTLTTRRRASRGGTRARSVRPVAEVA